MTTNDPATAADEPRLSRLREVFTTFLKLGCTSFGGPIAHLGYFRNELVIRRRWIDEDGYAAIVGLAQFLPGPSSSQVGFALGVLRGRGLLGGALAWLAFSLPSALLLFAFAAMAASFAGPLGPGLLHGLKLVAVAVVAHALLGMARSLAPDRTRASIALAALAAVTMLPAASGQLLTILLGAGAGLLLCRETGGMTGNGPGFGVSRQAGATALILFALLLTVPPFLAGAGPAIALFDAFYRSGALVFGGGHVVLPLLRAETVAPGWISAESFLTGYGLAQAVPGPLFTFAAYLGAQMNLPPNGATGAALALLALSLPGLLLIYGMLPFWERLRHIPTAQAALRGINAAVVGILAAALYDPVWTSAILRPTDFLLAAAGFLLLTVWKAPSWVVVLALSLGGVTQALI